MINLKGDKVTLRAVEPADINYLYEWENDTDVWGVSGTVAPFSHHTLALFIEAQREDIFTAKQIRLMICDSATQCAVGAIDLFEFDVQHLRAGVGIMIAPAFRKRGYAANALQVIERYCIDFLRLHQLWCNIGEDNAASLKLFSAQGYTKIGIKRDWNISPDGYKSEIMLQKIL